MVDNIMIFLNHHLFLLFIIVCTGTYCILHTVFGDSLEVKDVDETEKESNKSYTMMRIKDPIILNPSPNIMKLGWIEDEDNMTWKEDEMYKHELKYGTNVILRYKGYSNIDIFKSATKTRKLIDEDKSDVIRTILTSHILTREYEMSCYYRSDIKSKFPNVYEYINHGTHINFVEFQGDVILNKNDLDRLFPFKHIMVDNLVEPTYIDFYFDTESINEHNPINYRDFISQLKVADKCGVGERFEISKPFVIDLNILIFKFMQMAPAFNYPEDSNNMDAPLFNKFGKHVSLISDELNRLDDEIIKNHTYTAEYYEWFPKTNSIRLYLLGSDSVKSEYGWCTRSYGVGDVPAVIAMPPEISKGQPYRRKYDTTEVSHLPAGRGGRLGSNSSWFF